MDEEVKVLTAWSCPTLWDSMDFLTSLLCPWNPPGKYTGLGSRPLLQEIFPTQGLNLGLLHGSQIL